MIITETLMETMAVRVRIMVMDQERMILRMIVENDNDQRITSLRLKQCNMLSMFFSVRLT